MRPQPSRRRMTTLGLAGATFFIVSGGPYGLEEIVLGDGYAGALLLLAVVPFLWSLPVALMVGELGAALPATGGFYAWVRRALGPFWGLQEAWLSLAVGIVDIAIYPTLLVTYLGRLWPEVASGGASWAVALASIAACTAWNALGVRSMGRGSTVLAAALLAPFAWTVAAALLRLPSGGLGAARAAFAGPASGGEGALVAGLMLAMWNLMGFDNASTFASEVEDPGRSYPRAMMVAVVLITAAYVATVLAASVSGLAPSAWAAGSWVEVGARLGGRALAGAMIVGGAISAVGMYGALLLSWSRIPVALAEDGWLPRALARRSERTGAPVAAIALGGALSGLCFGLGLRRLVEIDVLLYGAALVLELAALVVLRVREPALPRPYRVPGGLAGAVVVATVPTALLAAVAWEGRAEPGALGLSAAGLSGAIALVGVGWWVGARGSPAARLPPR